MHAGQRCVIFVEDDGLGSVISGNLQS